MTRGLWIARAFPFPADTGDRIYSGRLLHALAATGVQMSAVGFASPAPLPEGPVEWIAVPGMPRGTARSLLSLHPLVAAAHATTAFRQAIDALARQRWDFVVFDHYGTGWAVDAFRRGRHDSGRPLLVHVAHDHEASVYASLVRGWTGSPVRRLGLAQNWLKIRRAERRLVRSVDLVTTITSEDAARFAEDAPQTARVVLTPGYGGPVAEPRRMAPELPRRVVMVGNYRWIAKAENLRQFVAVADPLFQRHGIQLHVIGAIAEAQASEIRARARATVIHGYVDDVLAHFEQARLAVVPEVIGGGFKLKYLDYIFGRVPVASLTHAMAGLPEALRRAMIGRDDLPALAEAVVQHIDRLDELDRLQQTAFAEAEAAFRWPDRGQALLEAIASLRPAGIAPAPRRALPAEAR